MILCICVSNFDFIKLQKNLHKQNLAFIKTVLYLNMVRFVR